MNIKLNLYKERYYVFFNFFFLEKTFTKFLSNHFNVFGMKTFEMVGIAFNNV